MLKEHNAYDNRQSSSGRSDTCGRLALRVLVVDDNVLSRRLVSATLSGLVQNVDMAEGGKEALAYIDLKMPYDVIFMDCHMPDMDGAEVTRKIGSLTDKGKALTPIIGLTADMRLRARNLLIGAGMNDVVAKPLNVNILKTLLPH